MTATPKTIKRTISVWDPRSCDWERFPEEVDDLPFALLLLFAEVFLVDVLLEALLPADVLLADVLLAGAVFLVLFLFSVLVFVAFETAINGSPSYKYLPKSPAIPARKQ
jgi:hypothetical protein